jgi:hypothetical protein
VAALSRAPARMGERLPVPHGVRLHLEPVGQLLHRRQAESEAPAVGTREDPTAVVGRDAVGKLAAASGVIVDRARLGSWSK